MPEAKERPAPVPAEKFENDPIYWFAAMELACERGDLQEANRANDRLRQLGRVVTFHAPSPFPAIAR
jgi:hypothetical protein